MGLRGFGAARRKPPERAEGASRRRRLPWKRSGLSRAERVVAFLQFLPITKGILAGTKMKLLPGQRRFVEAQHPLCEACLQDGAVVPAEVVDHRIPISERGRKERSASEAFPPLEHLASLCASHHNQKTRAEQLGQEDWMRAGCDVFGRPYDRDH